MTRLEVVKKDQKEGWIEQAKWYRITCPHCKKTSPLSKWGFVQTHWYESPHGCMGGDTWHEEEDILLCLLVCPHACLPDGSPCASRIYDFGIERKEKDWVFGLIQKETKLWRSNLLKIFAEHYVQYRKSDPIETSKEYEEKVRKSREEYLARMNSVSLITMNRW